MISNRVLSCSFLVISNKFFHKLEAVKGNISRGTATAMSKEQENWDEKNYLFNRVARTT